MNKESVQDHQLITTLTSHSTPRADCMCGEPIFIVRYRWWKRAITYEDFITQARINHVKHLETVL